MIGGAQLLAFFKDEWFLAFVAGAVMIAIFARRRLDTIASELSPDYAAVLTVPRASQLVGRRQFTQAYIVYLSTLLLIYLVLCLSQPIAGYFAESTGIANMQELWATPAGPFAISTFIVAVGPNAGLFEDFETAIRRLAHRLAGIPEDLLSLLNDVKRFNLFEPQFRDSLSWETFATGDEAERAAIVVGFDAREARALEHNIVSALALNGWVVAEAGRNIWSEATRSRFGNQMDHLKKDTQRFRNNLDLLLKETRQLKAFAEAAKLAEALPDPAGEADRRMRLSAIRDSHEAEISPILSRWQDTASDAASLATAHRVLFALFTVNDKNPTYDRTEQTALAALLDEVWRPRLNRTLNLVVQSAFLGFIGSLFAVAAWKIARAVARDDAVGSAKLLKDSITIGVNNSVGVLFALLIPILLLVFLRFYRKSDKNWISLAGGGDGTFPVLQVVEIIAYSVGASIVLSISWFVVSQMISNPEGIGLAMREFFGATWLNKTLISGAGGILACLVCYVLDRWEAGTLTIRARVVIPLFTTAVVACYIAIVHSYSASEFFWKAYPSSSVSPYTVKAHDLFVQEIFVYSAFAAIFIAALSTFARGPRPSDRN